MQPGELGKLAEERGFESLWFPEHTHIPVSRRTPPPTGDAELAPEYQRCLDPLVALAAAASATTTIRLGTGILLAAQRDPIVTAKAVATLDHLNGGRTALGVGFGWNEDELEHHGVAMGDRRAVAREVILAMQALWADDEASFDGVHVRFSPSWSWPKPVGKPPVIMGGAGGPVTFRHVAEYCDGWMPIHGRRGDVLEKVPLLREAWEAAGRDPAALQLGVFGCPPKADVVERYREAGFHRCVVGLPPAAPDVVLPVLDHAATLLASA
jgi:probable F420-dependent oxidoreductase